MVGVQRLDVSGNARSPVVNNLRAAAGAPNLVRKFPSEDSFAGLIAGNNSCNIFLVLCLCGGIGVPCCLCTTIFGDVSGHSTIIIPVVDEVDNELDAVLLGRADDVIETLKTIGSSVDHWILSSDERLEPYGAVSRLSRDIVKTPYTKDF